MAADNRFASGMIRDGGVAPIVPARSLVRRGRTSGAFERHGAAVVEFAIVAPLLLLVLLGVFEIGRVVMVQQTLTNSAREGARKGVLPGTTVSQVEQTIDNYIASCGLTGHTRQITPNPATVSAGTAIRVTVSIPYANVSWLPLKASRWMQGKTLSAVVEMRKEEY